MKTLVIFFIVASCAFTVAKNQLSWNGQESQLRMIIDSGNNVNARDSDGMGIMHLAAINGFNSFVQLLIKKGYKNQVNSRSKAGDTPLHLAVWHGRENIVRILIENGSGVDARNHFNNTPLHIAAWSGRENMARILIESGSRVEKMKNNAGYIALHEAAKHGHEGVAKFLIESGSDVNAKDNLGWAPLHLAVSNGHENIARDLIQSGSRIDEETNNNWTPLILAVWKEYENIVRLLIQRGCDVNAKNNFKDTALQWAARSGQENMVRILIQCGSNVDMKNSRGYIALHEAAKHGHEGVVKYLIEKFSDVNARDNDRFTPLHVAATFGHENIARILIQSGSRIDEKTKGNRTSLENAAYYGFDKIVELLLSEGADINHKNNEGQKARDIAAQRGHQKIVDLLDRATRVSNKDTINKYIEKVCERYSSERPTDHILDGHEASPGDFPWMAALGYFNTRTNVIGYRCGGTIISEQFILTAAHCTQLDRPPVVVRLGTIYLSDPRDAKIYYIEKIIRHEDYSNVTKKNDIALLRFSKNIQLTPDIRPACIETDARDHGPNVWLNVTGFGSTSANRNVVSDRLLAVEVKTMPLSQCNTTYLTYNERVNDTAFAKGISNSQYCAYDPVGHRDSCRGDSGGPLQIFRNSYTSHVVGIVSFGVSCGSRYPGVYTRVAHYTDWIASHVWPDATNN